MEKKTAQLFSEEFIHQHRIHKTLVKVFCKKPVLEKSSMPTACNVIRSLGALKRFDPKIY